MKLYKKIYSVVFMRASNHRTEKYKAKLSGDVAKSRAEGYKKTQKASFESAVEKQVEIERLVKSIISSSASSMFNHYYCNFGKKVYQLSKKHKGSILLEELQILDDKWERRGLNVDLLVRIKQSLVPGYAPPAPPVPVPFSYDYSTGAGTDKWAYRGLVNAKPPATGPDLGLAEFTGAEYTNIGVDNDQKVAQTSTTGTTWSAMNFKINIAEDPTKITTITFLNKAGCSTQGGTWYIWNYNTSSWEVLDDSAVTGKRDWTATKTENIGDYIQGGVLWLTMEANHFEFFPGFWLGEIWDYYVSVYGEAYP